MNLIINTTAHSTSHFTHTRLYLKYSGIERRLSVFHLEETLFTTAVNHNFFKVLKVVLINFIQRWAMHLLTVKKFRKPTLWKKNFTVALSTHVHQDPTLWGEVVWKWSLVGSFKRTDWYCSCRSHFEIQTLQAVIRSIWTVKGFCVLLRSRSAGLVCFTWEAQASTRPQRCLSQCSHLLISAKGLRCCSTRSSLKLVFFLPSSHLHAYWSGELFLPHSHAGRLCNCLSEGNFNFSRITQKVAQLAILT